MKRAFTLVLILLLLLTGCRYGNGVPQGGTADATLGAVGELGDDSKSFGEALDSLGAYDGYFEGASADLTVTCVSGTPNAYRWEGTTLYFTAIGEASVYSIAGTLRGNIVIDVGDGYKFDLELCGVSLVCNATNPIEIRSGDEVAVKAKKDCENYIYDMRPAIDGTDESLHAGAIHSEVDLEIGGKGSLTLVSENNNGIHSKDDLQVKNLTLLVACVDNALKGNDSVEITGGALTLIASGGDGIKTSNSDVSEKGNQRGTVSILGGTHEIYAACDGIDAAYDVVIDDASTVLSIYTDKYSNYSGEVTATKADVYYIRFAGDAYSYSVKYVNSESDVLWVNATYHSSVPGGRSTYYYYSFPKHPEYSKMQFFVYSSTMTQGQEAEYLVTTDLLTPNTAYDTFALSARGNQFSYSWTNYTTQIQEGGFGRPGGPGGGPGGMGDGNSEKGDHSTKGIKAANEIRVLEGRVTVKSYDDAIHANNDTALENGATPLGNITVSGGSLTLYTNDDGLHADGTLSITGGDVWVTNSYEGLEGTYVSICGGSVSVCSKDDGINGTATSGTAIAVSGGSLYIYCSGDGIDSNSRTSYAGIVFSGGNTVVISTSGGNSAIDTEKGYGYTGGNVIAVMPRGGMSSEATHCQSFSSVGKSTQTSLTAGEYLVVGIGTAEATVKVPSSMSAYVIVLGDTSPKISTAASVSVTTDANGVAWN
ncbi:MAG: carbohydrate-binding domain-containing protein [Clostridia bacterium]|nr:carbohydrate-binding domain-containing protein [Clostridia bacterium]